MSILVALVRSTRRLGFRGLLGLALLIGLAGGAALTGLGAARRTDSAFDRLVDDTEGWDVLVNPDRGIGSELQDEDIASLPMVESYAHLEGVGLNPRTIESFTDLETGPSSFVSDGHVGYDFARPLLTEGRMPDPEAAEELFVSTEAADELDLAVGDVYPVRLLTAEDFIAMEEAPVVGDAIDLFNASDTGRIVELEVVGVGTFFDEIVIDEGFGGGTMIVGPAFWSAYDEPSAGYWGGVVRLKDADDIGAFRNAVEALVPDEPIAFQSQSGVRDEVEQAVTPHVSALLVFTVVAAGVGLVIVGQATSRRLQQDAGSFAPLGALGVTRRQRAYLGLVRVAIAALGGTVLAVVIAFVASPIGPVGVARTAEPDPGLRVEPSVLVAGGLAVFLVCVLLAVRPAFVSARRPAPVDGHGGAGSWAAGLGLAPPAVTGVRFALDRGAVGVPARATLVGAVTSVALVVGTVAYSASLNHLVDHSDLYGTPWNALLGIEGVDEAEPSDYEPIFTQLEERDDVSAFGLLYPGQLNVDGMSVPAVALDPSSKPIEATILDGRAPTRRREIAVGDATLDDLAVELGDEVALSRGDDSTQVRVVGTVVFPAVAAYSGADKPSLGEGILASSQVLRRWGPEFTPFGVAVQLDGSDDAATVAAEIEAPPPRYISGLPASVPSEIEGLERVRATPVVLTGLLAALIALTVIHALAAAVRSRRGELAVLRTLGFTRSQVLRAVSVQALVIAAVGLVIGVPIGVAVGRLAWTWQVGRLGAVVDLVTPVVTLGALATAVVGLSLLAGLVPGLRAAAAHPASILRTE